MANYVLFVSSLVMTFIHGITLFHYPSVSPFYGFMVIRGCLSSIYNHGSNNLFAKWYDRTVMRESFFADLFYMIHSNTLGSAGMCMCFAALLYLISKILQSNFHINPFTNLLHIMAHFGITIAHVIVITTY